MKLQKTTKTNAIQQTLAVRDWPLNKKVKTFNFGHLVGIGVFPDFDAGRGFFTYADFTQENRYVRYRLPHDRELYNKLFHFLMCNLLEPRNLKFTLRVEGYLGRYLIEAVK